MESVKCFEKRRRKFLDSPRLNKDFPKAWAYKDFLIGDLFEKVNTNTLKYKVNDLPKEPTEQYNLPALTAGIINQGLSCYVPRENATILKNVISVSGNGANSGAMFYQDEDFTILQDAYAIRFIGKQLTKEECLYIISALQKVIKDNFNWVNKAGWNKIKKYSIHIPVTQEGEIDFDYMEKYIRELELARIRELVAYLEVCGFSNCTLTPQELSTIEKSARGGVKYKNYMIDSLFMKMNLRFVKSNFDKLRDISKEQNEEYNIPLVNAKDGDNGIMYYGRERDFETTEMSIDIVNDGAVSTGNVYPQPQKTGVLYNAYLVKFKNYTPTEEILIYCSASLQKSIKKKFGYDNKAGWNKVKEENVCLPVDDRGEIDYKFMETYIRAVEKQCIKHVIAWKDKIIQTTKEIVG